MIVAQVTQKDNGLLDRIRSITNKYQATIEVGYDARSMYKHPIGARRDPNPDPISMKDLAQNHEEGRGVPDRPFMQPALDANRRKYGLMVKANITPIFRRKKTLQKSWNELGLVAIEDIRSYMKVRGNFKPLAEETIYRKQGSTPLLDTGQLREKLQFKVK